MSDDFTPNPELQAYARQAAAACVRYLETDFGRVGDFSDQSVRDLEEVIEMIRLLMPDAQPSQEDIEKFAPLFGSYVGETFRRNHGGEWGLIHPGVVTLKTRGELPCFPWGRIKKCLKDGMEANLPGWYDYLIWQAEPYPRVVPPPLPSSVTAAASADTRAGALPPPLPPVLPGGVAAKGWLFDSPGMSIRKAIEMIVGGVDFYFASALFIKSLTDHPLYIAGDAQKGLMTVYPYPDQHTGKSYQVAFTSMQDARPLVKQFAERGMQFFPLPVEKILEALPSGLGLCIDAFGPGSTRFDIEADEVGPVLQRMRDGISSKRW